MEISVMRALKKSKKLREALKFRDNYGIDNLISYIINPKNSFKNIFQNIPLSSPEKFLKQTYNINLTPTNHIDNEGIYLILCNKKATLIVFGIVLGRTCSDTLTIRKRFSEEDILKIGKVYKVEEETVCV